MRSHAFVLDGRTRATMVFRLGADAVLLLHLSFILFVVLGAALAAWRRWVLVFHLPAALWGFFIEITGRICPLTYLENALRVRAGLAGYEEDFVEHYLLSVIYPAGLTTNIQFALAGVVVVVNLAIYAWLLKPWRAAQRRRG